MAHTRQMMTVAAAVLLRPDASFLLATRPPGKSWAGYWEFPGGKVEAHESPYEALVRELDEELGVQVTQASRWLTRVEHNLPQSIQLYFYRVVAWRGEPVAREGQTLAWQDARSLSVYPILPANIPVIKYMCAGDGLASL